MQFFAPPGRPGFPQQRRDLPLFFVLDMLLSISGLFDGFRGVFEDHAGQPFVGRTEVVGVDFALGSVRLRYVNKVVDFEPGEPVLDGPPAYTEFALQSPVPEPA